MKVVLLTNEAPNQVALAVKIAAVFNLSGIVIEKRRTVKKKTVSHYLNAILDRTLFFDLRKSWIDLQQYYKSKYVFPDVKSVIVSNINQQETVDFLLNEKPDLVMVSGTHMVRDKILSLRFKYGIINLHTGLSPYVKGGPNCTNWCLAEDCMHLIGNTVMWLDAGIDSGDIISTELTALNGNETLSELHLKVMEHAHDLYLRVAAAVEKNNGRVKSLKQGDIVEGKTYYSREWTTSKKWSALRHFRKLKSIINSTDHKNKQAALKLVSLQSING